MSQYIKRVNDEVYEFGGRGIARYIKKVLEALQIYRRSCRYSHFKCVHAARHGLSGGRGVLRSFARALR